MGDSMAFENLTRGSPSSRSLLESIDPLSRSAVMDLVPEKETP